MGHSAAGCSEMKMNKRINNDEKSPAIPMVEKKSFYACVKIHPNLITRPNCNEKKKKKGKSVFFGYTSSTVFSCNLNIY